MSATLTAGSVLGAQVAVERENVARARAALADAAIEPRLRDTVRVRFEQRFLNLEQRLAKVAASGSKPPPALAWQQLAGISRDASKVMAECLAFLEGSLVRSAGIDDGICALADGLLARIDEDGELNWGRLTIPGEVDLVDPLADIVRVRFPEFTLWSLPVAAHELGHVAVAQRPELGKALDRFGDDRKVWEEHFADAFATYALGPAFACATVLMRFRPPARRREDTHPADARRVHVVLDVLRRMHGAAGNAPYAFSLKWLASAWQATDGAGPAAEDRARLQAESARFYGTLGAHAAVARYEGWDRARRLARVLAAGADPPASAGTGEDVRDVLNAAWHCRLDGWVNGKLALGKLERRALRMAHNAVGADGGGS